MMTEIEMTEFTTMLLDDHVITLFDEEGEVQDYNKGDAVELSDYIFNVEMSAIVLKKDGKHCGQMQLVMDNCTAKGGVYVEIQDHSDNDEITKLVEKAAKYYPDYQA